MLFCRPKILTESVLQPNCLAMRGSRFDELWGEVYDKFPFDKQNVIVHIQH